MNIFEIAAKIGLTGVEQTRRGLNDVTNTAEKSSSIIGKAFKSIGAAVVAAFAIDKIKDFGVELVNTSAEVAAEEAAFTQIMGDYAAEAARKVGEIAKATGMVDSRLTPYMTSMSAKFKGLGFSIEEATDLASVGLNIAADAAAFWDKSLTDSMSALNSFVNGNYEGGESIGLFANETTLAAWAAENLGFEWKELTEKEKQFARLKFAQAMQAASGAAGQAAKESGAFQNVIGNIKEAWRQLKAAIGTPLLELILPVIQNLTVGIQTLQEKWVELQSWVAMNNDTLNKWKDTVLSVAGAVGVLLAAWKTANIINDVMKKIKATNLVLEQFLLASTGAGNGSLLLTGMLKINEVAWGLLTGKISLATAGTWLQAKAQSALNLVMNANPILLVVMAIAALVAAFILLYNNSESFREVIDKLWGKIKEELLPVFEKLQPVFEELITTLIELVSVIMSALIPIIEMVVDVLVFLLPYLVEIVDFIVDVLIVAIKVLTEIIKVSVQVISAIIKAVVVLLEALIKGSLTVISTVWKAVWEGVKLVFTTIWNAIMNVLTTILNGIKNAFNTLFVVLPQKAKEAFTRIKDAIVNPIKQAVDKVKEFIGKLKNLFTSFKAKIKMPHIKITNGSWNPKDWIEKGIPKFSVEWYDREGIMTNPTLFGFNPYTNSYMGGGETEPEAIAKISTLQGYIHDAVRAEMSQQNYTVQRIYDILASLLPTIAEGNKGNIVLDTGALVGEIAPMMDSKLGSIYERKERGR